MIAAFTELERSFTLERLQDGLVPSRKCRKIGGRPIRYLNKNVMLLHVASKSAMNSATEYGIERSTVNKVINETRGKVE